MSTRLYLFTFDVPVGGSQKLHQAIDSDAAITDWMHHIDATYFIVSTKTAQQLADKFRNILGNGSFIVVQIKRPYGRQGWLPQAAWTWLDKYTEP